MNSNGLFLCRFVVRSLAPLLLLISICFAPQALAQSASRQLGPLSKRLSRVNVEKLTVIAKMTNDQREQAMVLYDGYSAGHKTLLQEADDAAKVLAEERQDDNNWEEFAKKQRDNVVTLFDGIRQNRADFLADLQAILTPEQVAHWEDCERFLRRSDTARVGFMAGSMVDVVAVAEQCQITREGEAANVLDQYEAAFDPVAKEWLAKLDMFFKEIKAVDPTKEPDEKKLFGLMQEIMELSLKVRNTNRSYARQLKEVLSNDSKAAFEKAFLVKSYPLVYDKRYVAKLFDKAHALNVLSAQQTTDLAALRESYERDVALVNAEWAKQIDDRQEKIATDPQQFRRSWVDGDALNAARKAREEIDKKTADRIKTILDDSLFEDATKGLKRDDGIHDEDIVPDFDEIEKEEEE